MTKLIIILAVLFLFFSVSVLTFAGGDKSTESMETDLESAGDTVGGDVGDSEEGDKEEEDMYQGDYVAVNANHHQVLGGKSENAFKGLENADNHSNAIRKSESGSKSSSANSYPKKINNGGSNKSAEKDNAKKNGGNKDKVNNEKKDKGNNGKGKK